MAHRTGMGLGFGIGANVRIRESGHDPARFALDIIDVTDSIRRIVFKKQFESIVILERTLANITELVMMDSILVSEGFLIDQRIAGRGILDTLEVSDAQFELRERVRTQSNNVVITDNVAVT